MPTLPPPPSPAWLDGSLPGDRGFDPLGLSKPTEYLQYDVDSLDQNKVTEREERGRRDREREQRVARTRTHTS